MVEQKAVHGVRRAKHLERVEPEARRFILEPHAVQTKLCRDVIQSDKRRRRVARQGLVKLEHAGRRGRDKTFVEVFLEERVPPDTRHVAEYTGRLEAVESVEVRARVNGYLQSIHFKNGTTVKQGDLLFVIDPRPYQAELERARAELGLANARLERNGKDVARAQMLVRARAISEEEVDTRVSEQRQAQESVQAARATVNAAQLNVEFTQVRAPISGRISRNLISVGNLINGGTTQSTVLTTIVSLDPIYCYFEADERSYLKGMRQVRNGDHANGRASKQPVYVGLADEANFPHQGSVDFVDNRLDQHTGTITVRLPGLFARLRPAGSKYKR
jgi:RND family efflux transporter MFP subunit